MTEVTGKEVSEMRALAVRLLDLADRLDPVPVDVPQDVIEMVERKLAARICLACDAKIPPNVVIKRGQENACYNTTRKRIRMGIYRERDLVMQGKLTAEHAAPGRPAKQDVIAAETAKAQRELAKVTEKEARERGED